jgi:pimeloyl-ACP methyl ester carboxylesterase
MLGDLDGNTATARRGVSEEDGMGAGRMRYRGALAGTALLCALAGCHILGLGEHEELIGELAWLGGSVATEEPGNSPLIVVLMQGDAQVPEQARIVDHFVLRRAGNWGFSVYAGEYYVGAFQDLNEDYVYDDEPCLPGSEDTRFVLVGGERREDVELIIKRDGRPRYTEGPLDIRKLHARTLAEQTVVSLGQCMVVGEVTTLDDPRFTTEIGKMGLWRRLDFVLTQKPGIWFLEPYDRRKIPVLFVHGITGHPREFAEIVEQMDRKRFQPWFFFYPSGAGLSGLGRFLAEKLVQLHVEHDFDELYVVAHSMGGLVARACVLEYDAQTHRKDIRLFVSISSPFGGDERAAAGVRDIPDFLPMPPAFRDVATGSEFLASVFYDDPKTKLLPRRLPRHVAYHLLYGYDNDGSGESGDGVLTLATMLRPEVQAEARSWRAVNADHVGILRDPVALAFLNETLEQAAH